jgi:16S rRNA (cytosine967-C5)-methyltransferase
VLVDVPCSGTGAWGANPENKWKHDYGEVLERLVVIQGDILARTAPVVKPGGRLVYASALCV